VTGFSIFLEKHELKLVIQNITTLYVSTSEWIVSRFMALYRCSYYYYVNSARLNKFNKVSSKAILCRERVDTPIIGISNAATTKKGVLYRNLNTPRLWWNLQDYKEDYVMIQCVAVLTTVAGQHMSVCDALLEDICERHCEDTAKHGFNRRRQLMLQER